jgi:hypothetical protein
MNLRKKSYGAGTGSKNLCCFCGRGGARVFGPAGKAHLACVPYSQINSYKVPVSAGGPWCPTCKGVGVIYCEDSAPCKREECKDCHGTGVLQKAE